MHPSHRTHEPCNSSATTRPMGTCTRDREHHISGWPLLKLINISRTYIIKPHKIMYNSASDEKISIDLTSMQFRSTKSSASFQKFKHQSIAIDEHTHHCQGNPHSEYQSIASEILTSPNQLISHVRSHHFIITLIDNEMGEYFGSSL